MELGGSCAPSIPNEQGYLRTRLDKPTLPRSVRLDPELSLASLLNQTDTVWLCPRVHLTVAFPPNQGLSRATFRSSNVVLEPR